MNCNPQLKNKPAREVKLLNPSSKSNFLYKATLISQQ